MKSIKEYIILRQMDDFLLLSSNKQINEHFISIMNQGFNDYGVHINIKKTQMNYKSSYLTSIDPNNDQSYLQTDFISWNGYLLNCNTLEIQLDTKRLLDISLSNIFNIELCHTPLAYISQSLKRTIQTRIKMILLDACINSSLTIAINIYQSIYICVIRLYYSLQSLYIIHNKKIKHNAKYLYQMTDQLILYYFKQIQK